MKFLLIGVDALEFRAHKVFSQNLVRPLRNVGAIIPNGVLVGTNQDTEGFIQECLALRAEYAFFRIQGLMRPPPSGTWKRVLYEEEMVHKIDALVDRLVAGVGAEAWLLVSDRGVRNWGIISAGGPAAIILSRHLWWNTSDAAAVIQEYFPARVGISPFNPELLGPRMRLNLGSGKMPAEGHEWINIDIVAHPGTHLVWDLSDGLPYPDQCADEVKAYDVLEHFSYHIASELLGEWIRVLKPEGEIRLRLPDLESLAQAYVEDREHNYVALVMGLFGRASSHVDTHLNAIDFEWLESQLEFWGCPKPSTERLSDRPWALTVLGVKE